MTSTSTVDVAEVIDRGRISPLQIRVFVLCCFIALLDGFDTQAIAFAVPLMAGEWGTPLSDFGVVFGAGLFGICVGSLAIAPLADRLGRRAVIIGATAIFGVLALATMAADNRISVAIVRFLTGLGLGGAMPNLIAMVAEYAPARKRALLITASFCGFPLGGALGGLVAAILVPQHGWPVIFLIGGVVPLLAIPALLAWLPESPRFLALNGRQPARISALLNEMGGSEQFTPSQSFVVPGEAKDALDKASISALFKDGKALFTLLLWAVFFCSLLIMYFLFSWLPSVLQRSGLPLAVAINAAVILNIGGVIGGLVIGRQVDRFGPLRVLAISYALGAIAVGCIGASQNSSITVLIAAFFSGAFIIGSQFAMNALAAESYPTSARSTGVGWALGVGRIGSVAGPIFGGMLVASAMSTDLLFLCAAVPAALSTACLILLRSRQASSGPPAMAQIA